MYLSLLQHGCLCALPLYIPQATLRLLLTPWSLCPCKLGIFFFASFRIQLETHPTLNKEKSTFYIPAHSSIHLSLTHRLFSLEVVLVWSPTGVSRYPHSGFISTVRSSRSLCLQFCAGTVPLCESPAGDACQHR